MTTFNRIHVSNFRGRRQVGFISPWIVSALVAVVAVVVCSWVIHQRDAYKKELARSEQNFQTRVDAEKVKIVEDLEEKYRADRVSYEVMARRMEKSQDQLKDNGSRSK